jgi:hypothetical protein
LLHPAGEERPIYTCDFCRDFRRIFFFPWTWTNGWASFPASSPSTPARSLNLATDLYKSTVVCLFLVICAWVRGWINYVKRSSYEFLTWLQFFLIIFANLKNSLAIPLREFAMLIKAKYT